ncbi:cupin domain-containing protein [Pseudomonas californiensis]|uniref:hypothetical protein n=1 Tax=Pseudomonas californiensis TaxID=2829823 RepID=UPI001E3C6CBD|nr:hypothetical protein [Pseudomonas californiensis]
MSPNPRSDFKASTARPFTRWSAGLAVIVAAATSAAPETTYASTPPAVVTQGIKAFKLCTGPDNLSHVVEGSIDQTAMTDVSTLHFTETPAHSTYNWHPAPEAQYVITLSGTLEFSTTGGENFVLHPGDVLVAQDTTGPGHRWKLLDDQPWRRAYIILKPGTGDGFIAKSGGPAKPC